MNNDWKKAAIYARVSSEKQDIDLSISSQLRHLREYAAKNGYQVAREFVDEAESGRTVDRPAFMEMVKYARHRDKPFEAILVWKYSRFTRSREDSIVYKAMLRKNNVQVISISEPHDDTPTGRLMEGIIENLDEFYSDNLGEEVTRGMRESAGRGFYLSARPPYGYRKIKVIDGHKERTKLDLFEDQSSIVKRMFEMVCGGHGLIDIVRDLNNRSIPGPRGKGWVKTSVYTILTNEIYTGTFIWGKHSKRGLEPVITENACPAIVDRETFHNVQRLMKERTPARTHPRRVASPFLLSGLAFCGHCGKALIARYAKSGRFSYYVCGTLDKKGAGACPSKYLKSEKFEAAVIDQVKHQVLTQENLKELVDLTNQELDANIDNNQLELDRISHATNDIGQRLDRLYDAIETGKVDMDDLSVRIKELRAQQENLQTRKLEIDAQMSDKRVELIDMALMEKYIADLRQILGEGPPAERKAFIRSFVKEIRVTGDEAVMTYSAPLPSDEVDLEGEIVPRIVRYGGR